LRIHGAKMENTEGQQLSKVGSVDEHKQSQAMPDWPERLSELILAAAGEGIYGLDAEGKTTFVNPAAAKMIGWAKEELIGLPQHDVLHHSKPDGTPYPRESCPIYAAFSDGEVHHVDNEVFWRKDGSSFPVEYTSTPIRENGKLVGAVVAFRDMTLKKQADDAVQKLRRQNELILEAAGEGIYGLDTEGRTTFVNPIAAKMIGWEAKDLIGLPQHDILHHSKPDGTPYSKKDCPIYAAFSDGKTHHVSDDVFWRKDRSSFPVEYTSTPIFENKKLVGAVVVFKDISERKAAEAALKKAHREVESLKNRLQAENIYLQEEIKIEKNFDEIIGQSPKLKKVLKKVEQVAPTDATVLIHGETGTGKELIARAIHSLSTRKDRPLVKMNCGAIPQGLLDSELFGHEKGAFTGALQKRIGRFELAHGGTVFLDEIGELPSEAQVRLLRILQEQEFERVGSSQAVKVDVRVIAATNRNLEQLSKEGSFRTDLFYRLNVFPLTLPSLRERQMDIPALVDFFLKRFAKKMGKAAPDVSIKTMSKLTNYPWPGNIRELENVIERTVILSQGPTLAIDESFEAQINAALPTSATTTENRSLESLERAHIHRVLKETNFVIDGKQGAAGILDIHPNTLRFRMKKLGIERPR
ncbi:MAG: sigma 54-interacting transcriptional regulator, partial [Nitrospiria bacterium]